LTIDKSIDIRSIYLILDMSNFKGENMAGVQNNTAKTKPLTSVIEDYLEAIFDLNREKNFVRVKDIAERMQVKMPSVSSMLKTLNNRGLVKYRKYEFVELTKHGAYIGREIRHRHEILLKFLTKILNIDFKVANEEACKMEHTLSSSTLDSLTDFIEFIHECPRTGESWLEYFKEYQIHGRNSDTCLSNCENFSCEFDGKLKFLKNGV